MMVDILFLNVSKLSDNCHQPESAKARGILLFVALFCLFKTNLYFLQKTLDKVISYFSHFLKKNLQEGHRYFGPMRTSVGKFDSDT